MYFSLVLREREEKKPKYFAPKSFAVGLMSKEPGLIWNPYLSVLKISENNFQLILKGLMILTLNSRNSWQ